MDDDYNFRQYKGGRVNINTYKLITDTLKTAMNRTQRIFNNEN